MRLSMKVTQKSEHKVYSNLIGKSLGEHFLRNSEIEVVGLLLSAITDIKQLDMT